MKMDVERIQKINALALDLLKQGLASSRDEAVVKAEEVFRDRDAEPYSEMRSRMNETKTDYSSKDSGDLHPEKVKDILEKNTTFIVKKFKEFQEKMESMEKEIGYLRNKMLFAGPTSKEVASQPIRGAGDGSSAAKPGQAAAPSASHPRSGNYTDTDVSIEKFFYMGHK